MSDELFETGQQVRRQVLGDEYVDRSLTHADDFSREFQELLTAYCWGGSWARDGLSLRDRSLLNLAMLGALGRSAEFKLHMRGALRNGCTKDEIRDTLIHLAIYAGAPAGVEGFRLAQQVFAEVEGG
jgi:4-carboxymuconolactone decarboxylase